jgi:hypothetical protein
MASFLTPELYSYIPLPVEAYIRILEIKPGGLGSSLDVSLRLEALNGDPNHEALSYTWGHPDDFAFVRCEGKRIKVPSNLHDALQKLRDDSRSSVLWADSICAQGHQSRSKDLIKARLVPHV